MTRSPACNDAPHGFVSVSPSRWMAKTVIPSCSRRRSSARVLPTPVPQLRYERFRLPDRPNVAGISGNKWQAKLAEHLIAIFANGSNLALDIFPRHQIAPQHPGEDLD